MTNPHAHSDLTRCQHLLGQLNDYIDGELVAELCHELDQHMAGCADCRVVFDTLAQTISLYHALDQTPVELPPAVEARLLRSLNLPGH